MRTVITLTGIRIQLPSNWAPIPLISHTVSPLTRPSFRSWLKSLKNGQIRNTSTKTQKIIVRP